MPLSRDSRAEKKLKAIRRAEFMLGQRLQRIDWEEDVLYPEIDALKAGRPVLGLEAGAVFDLQVAHADSDHSASVPVAKRDRASARPRATRHRRKSGR